jgi:hypothetical protein
MFTTNDIAKSTISFCDTTKMEPQTLLLIKNSLSPAKVAEDFCGLLLNCTLLNKVCSRKRFILALNMNIVKE